MSYPDPENVTVAGTTCNACGETFCYNSGTGREPRHCRDCARQVRE
jgi:hypothetical protein